MKETNKIISIVAVTIVILSLCASTFNHFNPWIGISFAVLYVWLLFNFLNKKPVKNEKDKI